MDVLLTFTGFHDPYFKGLIDREEQPGPILSLLSARSFDHIYLFDTPMTKRVTQETMSFRFLHTSDWQLGMTRDFLSEGTPERYSEARA